VVVGGYNDASNVIHAFIRASSGTTTTFEAPGAGVAAYQGTTAASINAAGTIVGSYTDPNNQYHGYVRTAAGATTSFDGPGLPAGHPCVATAPASVNAAGSIVGYCPLAIFSHSFKRTAAGTMTPFDAPGNQETVAEAISDTGTIAGFCYNSSEYVYEGFVRDPRGGPITTFVVPGSGTTPNANQGTKALAVGTADITAGYFTDASNVSHGFVRHSNGKMETFNAPGAGSGPNGGTYAVAINAAGVVAGYFQDAGSVLHGYLLTPGPSPAQ
jgi:hypothetical protein